MAIFGRFAMLTPVLKTAVSYPMATRFRTGMAFAMFSLIIFTMVIIATMTSSVGDIFADTETMKGGFDLQGTVSSSIPDIDTALAETDGMDKEFDTVASVSSTTLKLQQAGGGQKAQFFLAQGVDTNFTERVSYEFDKMAEGYASSKEVWQALSSEEGLVVVSSSLVGGRRFGPQGGGDESALLDPISSETVPDNLYIETLNPVSGKVQRLRVIGIFKGDAYLLEGVVMSQGTLNAVSGQVVPATSYLFATTADMSKLAHDLEKQFLEYGMDVMVLEEQIEGMFSFIQMMFSIFQGFLGLGLIAGIAALGVIATRSVVERRQQIGMLRAIGFQRRMVQFSFLLEFSFIALVGIAIGIALAIPLCYQLMESEGEVDLQITIPWASIAAITAGAYVASLITIYLPARQAANLYPAEALRYE
jgi:putative ABC transport system permease protein